VIMAGVRMGELVVSANPSDELVALGLGSCIGLAIVDRNAAVAGLAHIVLPESHPGDRRPGKFADTAVPELVKRMVAAGAAKRRLETAIVGGARMFEMSGALDIGARNEEAVRAELARLRVPVRAAETGGNQGRTVRIAVGTGVITVRIAGEQPQKLIDRNGKGGGRPGSGVRAGTVSRLVSRASALGGFRIPHLPYGTAGAQI
jgi:chemotaxis protein CheD